MTYLLDTNVVSEPVRPRPDPTVLAWLTQQDTSDLAISVVTIMELEKGILLLERRNPQAGARLRRWFIAKVIGHFAPRILPVDLAAARATAPLHVPNPAPERDALIAGTALAHDLIVVTRNVADFDRFGVPYVNPWETL
ncbi:MAG: type II toxin-antitoxin system VapC family toxin [Propionibacteriaceae bacterium]|jgi:predicted nucleic acid-binding protein|nr:type II toxin-antitoxin system VapC family toxin [Propionibacteriaceae bacterium]